MPRQVDKEQKEQRKKLVIKWLNAGLTLTEIQNRCQAKYGIGIHNNTIRDIEAEFNAKPKRKPKPKADLVLASDTGLVPAREVSPRLRDLTTQLADAMADEGVLTVVIDGREVSITHVPEEKVFEV